MINDIYLNASTFAQPIVKHRFYSFAPLAEYFTTDDDRCVQCRKNLSRRIKEVYAIGCQSHDDILTAQQHLTATLKFVPGDATGQSTGRGQSYSVPLRLGFSFGFYLHYGGF